MTGFVYAIARHLSRPSRSESGQALVMFGAGIAVFCGLVGLSIESLADDPYLDKKSCRWQTGAMLEVAVIEDPAAAEVSLDPLRSRLLAELTEPASATMLAGRVGLARQKVNYHLKSLEQHGLIELVAGASKARKRLATFAMDGEIRFASAAARAAFAEELASAVTRLVGKYHDESAKGGRDHRVIVAVHPTLKTDLETDGHDTREEP